jgi:superoxide dismutase, Cu-Zn family
MKAVAKMDQKGFVYFEEKPSGVHVKFVLDNFRASSTHAVHIHEFGDLTKGCASLGPHYNPTGTHHGSFTSCCRHAGDLINNFTTDSRGSFHMSYVDPSIQVRDILGRSVVIHDLQDDLGQQGYEKLSDKELEKLCRERKYSERSRAAQVEKLNRESLLTGNAGARLSCGVIGLASSG